MQWKLVTFIGGLALMLSASVSYISDLLELNGCTSIKSQADLMQNSLTSKCIKQLEHQARAISVKVLAQDFLATGIILKNQDNIYTVITNAHVLRADSPPYRIQTPDGKIYQATPLEDISFGKDDLALLQFQSKDIVYTVAALGSPPKIGNMVFAAGFPATEEGNQTKGFTLSVGKVSLKLDKALEGGYQLGYTNDIEKGMSGGALLNSRGEVVGVNGKHAYPLWDTPSIFADGTQVEMSLHQQIVRLSWAIPIEKVLINSKLKFKN